MCFLLILCLLMGLTACGGREPTGSDPDPTESAVISTTKNGGETEKSTSGKTDAGQSTKQAGKTDKNGTTAAVGNNSTATTGKTASGKTTAGKISADTTTAAELKESKGPYLVDTLYDTEDRVIADVIVKPGNLVDPTGKRSSARGIQNALDLAALNGGGTVWLPAGTYLLDSSLIIPAFTTLRGDWQDPDEGKEYGTILKISGELEESLSPIMTVGGSAGAMGLTVWFPEQSITNVREYPPVFYAQPGTLLQTVQNVTLINAYVGIRTSPSAPHEMLTVDTVKGTVLHAGAEAANQSDVGTWKNVTFNSSYWANAGKGMNTATKAQIEAYTRKNATGIQAADLEWTEFIHVSLSDFRYGFHIVNGQRIQFAGSLYDVTVTDCDYGIRADNMDSRWGMVVAASTIGGSKYAVYNGSGGVVKMSGVTLKGGTYGSVTTAASDTAALCPADTAPSLPGKHLEVLDPGDYRGDYHRKDCGAALQALLDKAGKAGGGVVYLPAGTYLLKSRLRVPANVELRGASSVGIRGVSGKMGGTVLMVEVGIGEDAEHADIGDAVITLAGKGAGVRGLMMVWPTAYSLLDSQKIAPLWCYAIRGKASDVYAVNVCLSGAYNGVDFTGCDRHCIKRLVTCCLHNTMTLGGTGGTVEECLQNATVLSRMGGGGLFTPLDEGKLFTNVFDPVTRPGNTYIRLTADAKNTTIYNTFAYGIHTLISNDGAAGTRLINLGADNMGGDGYLIDVAAGSLTGVNLMRWNGRSYRNDGTLHLYNRLTINDKNEADF